MADQKSAVAEEKVVETETTETSSPQVESPITGDETTQKEAVDQLPVAEEPNEPVFQTEEQRRAFQEQRQEIKRLKEKAESREESESAFDVLRPKTPPVGMPGPIDIRNFTDQVTGDTNWSAYNQAVQQREQNLLQQARAEAAQAADERIDEESARNKYPELFADKHTEKLMASQWLFERMNGNNVSVSDIAEEFARNSKQAISKAEKLGEEKALNEVSEKEKAGLSSQGQTSSQSRSEVSAGEQANLSHRTRMGDNDATAARISKIPWANK